MVQSVSSPPPSPRGAQIATLTAASMVETIIGCKWSVRLLLLVADGCRRPGAMLRACPGLSAKVMNERLRKMTRYGIVRRTVYGEKPPIEVQYALTAVGRRFMRILDEVQRLQEALDSGAPASDRDLARPSRRVVTEA